MAQTEKNQNPKPKKKWGFLGTLLRLFLFFVLLLALATAGAYFYRKEATVCCLNFYTARLAQTLTNAQYYQVEEDAEFRKEVEGKQEDPSFSKADLQKEIFSKRQDKASKSFANLITTYEKTPAESKVDWYKSFKSLNETLRKMFQDQKITPAEFDELVNQVDRVAAENVAVPATEPAKSAEPIPSVPQAPGTTESTTPSEQQEKSTDAK